MLYLDSVSILHSQTLLAKYMWKFNAWQQWFTFLHGTFMWVLMVQSLWQYDAEVQILALLGFIQVKTSSRTVYPLSPHLKTKDKDDDITSLYLWGDNTWTRPLCPLKNYKDSNKYRGLIPDRVWYFYYFWNRAQANESESLELEGPGD